MNSETQAWCGWGIGKKNAGDDIFDHQRHAQTADGTIKYTAQDARD